MNLAVINDKTIVARITSTLLSLYIYRVGDNSYNGLAKTDKEFYWCASDGISRITKEIDMGLADSLSMESAEAEGILLLNGDELIAETYHSISSMASGSDVQGFNIKLHDVNLSVRLTRTDIDVIEIEVTPFDSSSYSNTIAFIADSFIHLLLITKL